jgi:DNA (cytosine-5)-methyltransferase 1
VFEQKNCTILSTLIKASIPFVDIFAGPGGLGEGFSSCRFKGEHPFKPVLSIEKEPRAHETLTLRSFFRQFRHSGRPLPKEYYEHLRGNLTKDDLFNAWPDEAENAYDEAQLIELGGPRKEDDPRRVNDLLKKAVGGGRPWVLLGGPPCQAYSLVGRSRMGGISADDPRVTLYKHYLWILANHKPAAFIFENVKGLASSKLKDNLIFNDITSSLQNPAAHLEGDKNFKLTARGRTVSYRLFGLETPGNESADDWFSENKLNLESAIIRTERHGIPQARHRIIILGIRTDLGDTAPPKLALEDAVPLERVLDDLPRLRSGLSKETDGDFEWIRAVERAKQHFKKGNIPNDKLLSRLNTEIKKLRAVRNGRGGEFVASEKINPSYMPKWYVDSKLAGACNHTTRAHLTSDLHRYLYAAVYARVNGYSPKLQDFPRGLLPDHKNAAKAIESGLFNDRFRVQLKGRPATTVTSHISKDGHYFIHHDPTQCRSLTVREAARIQTFPDSYFFCGPRTSQYTQVGNAVPPLLANKIANLLFKYFKNNKIV